MKAKFLGHFFIFSISLIILGCSSSPEKETKKEKSKKSVFEIENTANGKINGKEWAAKYGIAQKEEVLGVKEAKIRIINEVKYGICDRLSVKIPGVMVILGDFKIGKFSIADLDNQTETGGILIYDPKASSTPFYEGEWAKEGFVEITSINKDKNIIKGNVEAFLDENNTIKGNFVVEMCSSF